MPSLALTSVLSGLSAHVVFNKFQPSLVIEFALLLFGAPTVVGTILSRKEHTSLLRSVLTSIGFHLATLIASTVVYRLSPFHPLARYPGPVLARVTRFWAFSKALGGKHHLMYHQLHEKYGDVVRTGPDHLFIRDVKAVPVVLGANPLNERWLRGPHYEVVKRRGIPGSIFSLVSPTEHGQRRRIWERAFTTASLAEYEPMIRQRLTKLIDRLSGFKGEVIDLGQWLCYYTLDSAGDLAYHEKFNLVENGDQDSCHWLKPTIEKSAKGLDLFGIIPWVRDFLEYLPRPAATRRVLELARDNIEHRSKKPLHRKDFWFHLLDEDGSSGHEQLPLPTLILESGIILVTASDTTGVTLTNVFYFLLTHPDEMQRLREEIDAAIPQGPEYPDTSLLAKLPFLQAIINETLRLLPVIPGGVPRVPPKNGPSVAIGDIIVPPSATVQIPTWTLHRDPRYFWPNPDSFMPSRWLVDAKSMSKEDFRLNTMAWIPFSYGPQNCVGKQLAMNQMRLVIVSLLRTFEMKLAPGWDPRQWEQELRDGYILNKGKLPVTLTPRAH